MFTRTCLVFLLVAALCPLFAGDAASAPQPAAAAPAADESDSYFALIAATEGGKPLFKLGTALVPDQRVSLNAGKVLCVHAPGKKGPAREVQEITLGLQWSIKLIAVKGSAFRAQLAWSVDNETGRTETWIDRVVTNHGTVVSGTLGKPVQVAIIQRPGGPEHAVALLVERR